MPACRSGVANPADIVSPTQPKEWYVKPSGRARRLRPVVWSGVRTRWPKPPDDAAPARLPAAPAAGAVNPWKGPARTAPPAPAAAVVLRKCRRGYVVDIEAPGFASVVDTPLSRARWTPGDRR